MFYNIFYLLYRPEYIALIVALFAVLVSIIAIFVNVYISWRNRKYALAREEYFKLQQVVERIDAKLLVLENHREKLKIFFEQSFKASKNQNSVFVDMNNTFNLNTFEENSEMIAALIDIYFNNMGDNWNFCLVKFNELLTLIFRLNKNIEYNTLINWEEEARNFNKISLELNNKPKEISDALKNELKRFKERNL